MFLLLVVLVTAIINFVNFMDGLDGLVAGCFSVILLAASIHLVVPFSFWCLVGAVFGFLICNWSPARVFMGDVGSTFLGAVFAGLVLNSPTWEGALSLLLVATPLLGDACFCVVRRLLVRQPVFSAHRLHLFQRLHQCGWSHARVSCTYIVGSFVLAIPFVLDQLPWLLSIAFLEIFIGLWLDRFVAVPFSEASLL